MRFGQHKVFAGIRKIFANGNDRGHTGSARSCEHFSPVFIKSGIANMGMCVNQSVF
jgi:hypothetical protein